MMSTGADTVLGDGGVELVAGMTLFAIAGLLLAIGALIFGKLLRPKLPSLVKGETYECGEVAVGSSWVQFDLRFYVVALVFLVFDVEIALLYPWAVVFGGGTETAGTAESLLQIKQVALYDMLFFFGVVVVGFLYLWRFGYLNWVWSLGGRIAQTSDES
jgi:NADH-quinone oxidoreductase subunit A